MKVVLLMALTLDGKIAQDADHFPDWTEKADKKFFMERTKEAGVFIIGRKTYDTIGRPLPGRKNIVLTRSPQTSDDPNLVFTNQAPQDLLSSLEKEGFSEVILAGGTIVNTLFAKENLIDEVLVTISPKLFGSGISLFDASIQMDLKLVEVEKIGETTIKARYSVQK